MKRFVLVLTALVLFAPMIFGRQSGLILQWDHDGTNTDWYVVTIDGNRTVVSNPTCTGTGVTRTCLWPLPTLTGGTHTFTVIAVSTIWGESPASDPLVGGPPVKPGALRVIKKEG